MEMKLALTIAVMSVATSAMHVQGMNSVTFELIDGAILTSPSIATSGVISSKEGVGVITCCLACAGTGNCAGIFYDSSLSICKPYSFQNYTSMNIYGIQNFVKISPECEKQGHTFNSKYRLCFDLFTNMLPWNQSRDACQEIGGQLMMLDTVPKIEFMTGYIGHIYPDANFWHIGASDADNEGYWRWLNGAAVSDIRVTTTDQLELDQLDCSALNRKNTAIQMVMCETTRRRICEWPNLI
uniref:C-type lectin domain-containing protein n=1 Tax=Magallana gigas TaxID=29159 RepID=A0A8W8HN12_MAGGI|nr:C-type lectin domain family 17, member A [Crassostrea gigas]